MAFFRLYLDGRGLVLPKPVVVDEINPRHATSTTPNTNNAHLDFEHLTLNNNVCLLTIYSKFCKLLHYH